MIERECPLCSGMCQGMLKHVIDAHPEWVDRPANEIASTFGLAENTVKDGLRKLLGKKNIVAICPRCRTPITTAGLTIHLLNEHWRELVNARLAGYYYREISNWLFAGIFSHDVVALACSAIDDELFDSANDDFPGKLWIIGISDNGAPYIPGPDEKLVGLLCTTDAVAALALYYLRNRGGEDEL